MDEQAEKSERQRLPGPKWRGKRWPLMQTVLMELRTKVVEIAGHINDQVKQVGSRD